MSEKIFIIDPFLHKNANISRDEFLNRIELVKAIRTQNYQLSFYFDSQNKWENIEHFHYIVNNGDFSKQKLRHKFPFAFEIPSLLYKWMRDNPVQIIQKQILFWLSGYYVFNPFKEFVPKELLEPIWKEVLNIINEYYPKDYESSFVIEDDFEEDLVSFRELHKKNIEYYLKTSKTFTGKELPEIFKDPSMNPLAFDRENKWGLNNDLQFNYSISYFSKMDWITIITRDEKELTEEFGIDDPKEIKQILENGETDQLLRVESNKEMFDKWKYTYKMYDIREDNIYSLYSNNIEKKKDIREKIPQHIIDKVWRRDLGQCAICGSKEKIEIDHIIPVSKGGSSTYRNLQLLCEKHNRSKHNKIG